MAYIEYKSVMKVAMTNKLQTTIIKAKLPHIYVDIRFSINHYYKNQYLPFTVVLKTKWHKILVIMDNILTTKFVSIIFPKMFDHSTLFLWNCQMITITASPFNTEYKLAYKFNIISIFMINELIYSKFLNNFSPWVCEY